MKRLKVASVILILLILGACSGMKVEEKYIKPPVNVQTEPEADLPDTLAAQDDYTRSFLVSTDEVEKDFYEMRTWTDAYSMWIPTNATLDKTFYEKSKKSWEKFLFAWNDLEGNISYGIYAEFDDSKDSEVNGLDSLTDFAQYEGEYIKTEDENNAYYYGKKVKKVKNAVEEEIPVYSDIGFVKHKKSNKSMGVLYKHHCADWTDNCTADTDEIKENFWKMVKSVKFDKK